MYLDLTLRLNLDDPFFSKMNPRESDLLAAGHLGTHMDSPLGRPIPLDRMDRRARLIDVRDRETDIGPDALETVTPEAGEFILFHTGHMARHPYGTSAYFSTAPQLNWSLIEALIDRNVAFIGIDGPALRRSKEEHARVDRLCEEQGAYVIENLANLALLQRHIEDRPHFPTRVAWTGHDGMTGFPTRVIALL